MILEKLVEPSKNRKTFWRFHLSIPSHIYSFHINHTYKWYINVNHLTTKEKLKVIQVILFVQLLPDFLVILESLASIAHIIFNLFFHICCCFPLTYNRPIQAIARYRSFYLIRELSVRLKWTILYEYWINSNLRRPRAITDVARAESEIGI